MNTEGYTKMKIVLLTLPHDGEYKSWITPAITEPKGLKNIPLGLISLATNAKENNDIVILDAFSEGWNINKTIEKINAQNPDVIGFSVVTRRIYSLYQLINRTTAKWKIAGGPHATYHAEELIEKGIDTVFVGPLADMEFYEWTKTPVRGIIRCNTNINKIKYPDRTLINFEDYFFKGKVFFEAARRTPMFTSVGCPMGCKFCSVQSKKMYHKKAEAVLKEMWYLKSLGVESVHFFDDNFNISNINVIKILDEMKKTGWKTEWSMRGQVKFDLSLVPRMKKFGLKRIHVGIESLDNDILKWFNKKHTINDIKNFCDTMRDNEIEILSYFIVGTPLETPEYLNTLPDKIRKLGIKHPYINILFPQPDTEYYDDLVSTGVYKYDIWKEYFKNPTPDFELPSPFENGKLENIMHTADSIIKEFTEL